MTRLTDHLTSRTTICLNLTWFRGRRVLRAVQILTVAFAPRSTVAMLYLSLETW